MSRVDILHKRIVERLQRFEASREPRHEIIWGLMGDVDGTISVPNQAGKVYCRLLGETSNLVRAWNSTMPLVVNLRVDIEVERQEGMPDDYTVLGVSRTGYGGYIDDTRNYVPPHHETHEYSSGVGGYDIVNVYTRALAELRADAQATPDMTVAISAGLYMTKTSLVIRGAEDSPTFSAAPAAGIIRYDLLYLDTGTNAYGITEGNAGPPGFANRPLPSSKQIAIAWVFFQNGDTAITNSMIIDARVLWLPIGALELKDHVLLSAPHTDTLVDTVIDGDVLIGNVTPKWSRLAITIPAANVRNVLGIDNAELRPSWKTALDATNPADIASAASPGTALPFSHRDHVHAHPVELGTDLHHAEEHPYDPLGVDAVHTGTLSGLHAHADNENKSGECNGSKTVFITAQEFLQEGIKVFLNGQLLTIDDDYTEGVFYDSFTMSVAPEVGDSFMLSYIAQWV